MNVRILIFILGVAGFLSAFNVVHAGDRKDISALVDELKTVAPSKNQHLGNSHYVTTNEARHDHFQKAISGLGGAYLGVGTNQNFEMIGWSRPRVAVMVDFDQMVVDMHHIYRLVFSHADTPDAFVELWAPKNLSTMLSLIDQYLRSGGEESSGARS